MLALATLHEVKHAALDNLIARLADQLESHEKLQMRH